MFQIQISKRRQKFTTVFTFNDERLAKFWLGKINASKNERVRLVSGS